MGKIINVRASNDPDMFQMFKSFVHQTEDNNFFVDKDILNINDEKEIISLLLNRNHINPLELLIKDMLKYNPNIKTIIQNINNKNTSMVLGNKNNVLYGKGYITDKLCGLYFKISPS